MVAKSVSLSDTMESLGPGLYSPNVFGDAALINYANLCKFVCLSVCLSPSTFWYTLF